MAAPDASFLAAVRGLRTFSHACDLDALAVSAPSPLALLQQLVAERHLDKEEAGRFWSLRLGIAHVDPFVVTVTDEAVSLLPGEIAAKVRALPLYRLGDALTVAMAEPEDRTMVERLARIMKVPVSPVFSFPADLDDLIRMHYATEDTLRQAMTTVEGLKVVGGGIDAATAGEQLAEMARSDQVIGFINSLTYYALKCGASDIHIEATAADSVVRFREDGVLRDVLTYPARLHGAVVARLKILCRLDIAERRLPQDGRFSMPFGVGAVDFRFSSIPSLYGEKTVTRLLGSTNRKALLSLDKMMISQSILRPMRRIFRSPAGIILVIGPTGSGKTTTLYAALAELNDRGVNISTIEDPVELKLAGITQTQVQAGIDLSFARMLRALLRQDPDIVLIGEIRDAETAKIAAEAALTGHLVLGTLHANTAPEAVIRLADMGVDPFMLAPTLLGVLSQRLARRICDHCKEAYRPAEEVLRRCFHDKEMPEVTFYRGRGCHLCNRTGYKGRVAFHELLLINRNLRTAISSRANQDELAAQAARLGYRPLRYDGLKKVLLGLTTIEEIDAQTPIEFEA